MFLKIIDFCAKNGFLKISASSLANKMTLEVGLAGSLLEENLKREWFDNFLNVKETPVFYNKSDFKDTFVYARKLLGNTMPFGLIEMTPISNKQVGKMNSLLSENVPVNTPGNFSDYFTTDSRLLYTIFMTPSSANQLFHQIQRQRKIWWRKV